VDVLWQGLLDAARLVISADAALVRIVFLSLAVSCAATLLSAAIGIPAGLVLAAGRLPPGVRSALRVAVNTGMALPPVVVGLTLTLLLWRTGPLGSLRLLYTPGAMVLAQLIVAAPLAAGLTRAAVEALDPELTEALRADGASEPRVGRELVAAALPGVLTAVAAAFGRAISEVGASLMVGGNILGQTRTLTTAITLQTGRGEFALAIALGVILLAVALAVNAALVWPARSVSLPAS
jgi:tungstate transport system permease protein